MTEDIAALPDDVRTFLLEGTRTGKLGYLARDGRPLVAPVWFTLEDDRLAFCTGATTAKGRALQRDPRVVMSVDLQQPPYAFVQIQGIAEISESTDDALRVSTIVGGRYMGADRAEEFGKRNGVPGELTIHIRPTKVVYNLDMTG